jgi:hypothetical protein
LELGLSPHEDAFRRHLKICGWLYTEHHDVINEWNGYWRFDRSEKDTGIEDLVPGMTLRDWHGDVYVAVGDGGCRQAAPGEKVNVPIDLSVLTDRLAGQSLTLRCALRTWDNLGRERCADVGPEQPLTLGAWQCVRLAPVEAAMPERPSVAVFSAVLTDAAGTIVARNFTTFAVRGDGAQPRSESVSLEGHPMRIVRVAPRDFVRSGWSLKQWNVLDDLKVNGAGRGFFEYRMAWPEGLQPESVGSVCFKAELSAKRLFGKDAKGVSGEEGDYMRGLGLHDPSRNPNAYPMTDAEKDPSAVRIFADGEPVGGSNCPMTLRITAASSPGSRRSRTVRCAKPDPTDI